MPIWQTDTADLSLAEFSREIGTTITVGPCKPGADARFFCRMNDASIAEDNDLYPATGFGQTKAAAQFTLINKLRNAELVLDNGDVVKVRYNLRNASLDHPCINENP